MRKSIFIQKTAGKSSTHISNYTSGTFARSLTKAPFFCFLSLLYTGVTVLSAAAVRTNPLHTVPYDQLDRKLNIPIRDLFTLDHLNQRIHGKFTAPDRILVNRRKRRPDDPGD